MSTSTRSPDTALPAQHRLMIETLISGELRWGELIALRPRHLWRSNVHALSPTNNSNGWLAAGSLIRLIRPAIMRALVRESP